MGWVVKHKYAFNKYLGDKGETVASIVEAKVFKTKKSALEETKDSTIEVEVLKII